MSAPPRVGVMVPSFRDDPADALDRAAAAEAAGLDGVFVYDHLWPMGQPERPALAPFPLLGAVAAVTSAIAVGTLVARVGLVPDPVLVAQFAALSDLAPGRVVAGLGAGDHLSFAENIAYGLPIGPAADRRRALTGVARDLGALGIPVWVGGQRPKTVAAALAGGAVPNFWQASPAAVAEQARVSEVTWGGMAAPGPDGAHLDAEALVAVAGPVAAAGASWIVFGWPVRIEALGRAAATLRAG